MERNQNRVAHAIVQWILFGIVAIAATTGTREENLIADRLKSSVESSGFTPTSISSHMHHLQSPARRLKLGSIVNSALGLGPVDTFGQKVAHRDSSKSVFDDHSISSHSKAGGRRPHSTTSINHRDHVKSAHHNASSSSSSGGGGGVGAKAEKSCGPPPPAVAGGAETEVACECARDPAAPGRYVGDWPAAYAKLGTAHERTLVFHGGGNALGNALLGYLTTYYDAMRSGRALALHREGIFGNILSSAFELGVPWATNATLHKQGPATRVFFDYAKRKCPQCVSYLTSGLGSPQIAGTVVAHSRAKNFHFDRPDRYEACYHASLGCPKPKGLVNTAKQEVDPEKYCGESLALRRLIKGPGPGLLKASPSFESHWAGGRSRLQALLSSPSLSSKVKSNSSSTRSTAGGGGVHGGPIWAVAIHARVEFPFVEQGVDEREPSAVAAVQAWLGDAATQKKLKELVALAVREAKKQHAKRRRRLAESVHAKGGRTVMATTTKKRASSRRLANALNGSSTSNTSPPPLPPPPPPPPYSSSSSSSSSSVGSDGIPPLSPRQAQRAAAVYVASETALVRRHIADLVRAQGCEADYFMLSGASHPVAEGGGARFKNAHEMVDDEIKLADALFPYLEWWALAHSKVILVRRHQSLVTAPSTYSGTAHLYGSWSEKYPNGHVAQLS